MVITAFLVVAFRTTLIALEVPAEIGKIAEAHRPHLESHTNSPQEDGNFFKNWAARSEQRNASIRELAALGDVVVPVLREWSQSDDATLRSSALSALQGVGSPVSMHALLAVAMDTKWNSTMGEALNRIGNYRITDGLSDREFEFLLATLASHDNQTGRFSGQAAWILGHCENIDYNRASVAIIERLLKQVEGEDFDDVGFGEAYMSRAVFNMNRYVEGLRDFRDDVDLNLVKEAPPAEEVSEVAQLWKTIALGMLGDLSQADQLMKFFNEEQDVSVKGMLIKGYAGAMGSDAIPFLKTQLNDKTALRRDPGPRGKPVYPVAIIAKSEIRKLESVRDEAL